MASERPASDDDTQTPLKVLLDASASSGSAESIIRAVGDMLSKIEKPSGESSSYRRLRMFSGTLPTPAGEEVMEHWLEQARLMVEESDCSAKEKRRRIMESLRGPALAVVKAVRTADDDVTPTKCLDAIDSAFGTAESGEDLYFDFRLLQQEKDEKLSDFLRRIEQSMTKVVSKGGIPASRVDTARVEQLLRGAIHSDMMLVQLKLRERKQNPPKFLELLAEIRAEEEYAAARIKLSMSVHRIHANQDVDSRQMDIQSLKSEIKEMKSMFASMNTKPHQDVADDKGPGPVAQGPVAESCENAEVAALKKQVKRLQMKMSSKRAKISDTPANALRVEPARPAQNGQKPYKYYRDSEESICYRCGENGHFATKCQNAENQNKVIQKLIRSLKKAKGGQSPSQEDDSPDAVCSVKKSLAIWGLSETSYPYLGYVIVDTEFPESVTGSKESISVLALVCPGPRTPDQIPVILGTNASLFKRLSKLCKETAGVDIAQTLGIRTDEPVQSIAPVTCEGEEDEVGCVKWMGPGPLTLPAGGDYRAVCRVELEKPLNKEVLMVEASAMVPLPAGVLLQPMVVSSSEVDVNHFTVLMHNESVRDTVIPVGTVMGHLCSADPVMSALWPKTELETEVTSPEFDPRLINFGDSPIPEQWKDRLRQKLSERASVFSLHEWDVGLAKGVEHDIRLADSRPFRERSRRLAPADIEDVRRHLQDLLKAELTKGYAPTQKGKKQAREKTKTYLKESEPFGDRWDQACTDAFHHIIQHLTKAPVLAFADANKPYILHTDASLKGLGAVLYQEYPEGLRPVAFASRKVSATEQRYPIHQLEFLALKWAVVDKFHDYLYGARFTVRTDNNPLTYVLTTAIYDFDIQYRPGKYNIDADLLSRNMADEVGRGKWEEIPRSGVKSICERVSTTESSGTPPRYIDQLGPSPECIPDVYAFPTHLDLLSLRQMSKADLIEAQKKDNTIRRVVEAMQQGEWPSDKETDTEVMLMKRERDRLVLKDGLLQRTSKKPSGEQVTQLVLPAEFRGAVLRSLHDNMGHLGVERTTDLLRGRFYWPKMAWDAELYVKNCGECVMRKTPSKKAAPLHQIVSSGPMDLVCIDFLSMEPDSKGISNVLVVTDHFTREARLPVDLCFGTSLDGTGDRHHSRYVEKLKGDLQKAYQLASKAADKTHERNKRAYDQKVSFQTIDTGDRVLMRNLGLRGKHKLESRWSCVPYVVVGKLPNLPVYRVKPEEGKGGVRTMHRDHLLPISQSIRMPEVKAHGESPVRPKTRLQMTNRLQRKWEKTHEVRQEDTESSSDMECERTHRSYREYMDKLWQRRTYDEPAAAGSSDEEHEPSVHDQSEEEGVYIREEDDKVSVREEPDDRCEECQSEDDQASANTTDSDHSESELEQEVCKTPISTPTAKLVSTPKTNRDLRTRASSKRQVKPVLRLTYDEPGKARDQPITIVHKGIIIKLGY
ncbi:hypothetical protein SKAU_G00063740 [Synaphobranchus kaupii]|uniref:Gypsy retrotransposon integrase-like protein 1 n=1 Tax=Synaphobranchus kaupii TaxID=118154 RepID=A0A9Q1J8V1_SYNKA|nr:hypothetical protein SKAU_G00063740 [Synaphobranchus kaupii]